MLNGAGLAAMRSQNEGVEATFCTVVVEDRHISIHVVQVIGVGWVFVLIPLLRDGYITVK